MIHNVTIENFRGIPNATLTGAKRINVLVGPNGTGKTAFLEGIYVAAGGSPELLLRTRKWRGSESHYQGNLDSVLGAIWADTFRDPNLGEAKISLEGDENETRSLFIHKIDAEKVISSTDDEQYIKGGIEFIYDSPMYGEQKVVVEVRGDNIGIKNVPSNLSSNFVAARASIPESESAQLYSQLRVEGRETDFEDALQREFPILSDLSVEVPYGRSAIYARLPNGRKLPLTLISGGINQLAGLMLRLAAYPRGVLMIDEIENGFYHNRYEKIWRTLFDLATNVDAQIFASTHSLECLQALKTALVDHPDDVRFIRTNFKDNEVSIEQMSGSTLFGALELGEVR